MKRMIQMMIFERGGRGCHGKDDLRHGMRHGGFGGRGFGGGGFSVRWGGDDDGRAGVGPGAAGGCSIPASCGWCCSS
jgi:hypothetical protein